MANQDTNNYPVDTPDDAFESGALRRYEQGEINSVELHQLSGIAVDTQVEVTPVHHPEEPRPATVKTPKNQSRKPRPLSARSRMFADIGEAASKHKRNY